MAIRKTLTNIVLAGASAFGGVGCDVKSNDHQESTSQSTTQAQPQYHTKSISGRIIGIDEDSFAIGAWYKGANFEFEHFRIQTSDGNIYKFIFPGPSNYQVGDKVDFQYRSQKRVSYHDLLNDGRVSYHDLLNDGTVGEIYLLQDGFFDVDGMIQR